MIDDAEEIRNRRSRPAILITNMTFAEAALQ
jgi:hypothetical protein